MEFTFKNRLEYDLKEACYDYEFDVCPEFTILSNDELLKIWNGIGAEGDALNILIPSTMYGLNMDLPSLPHDVAYTFGKTEEDRKKADDDFLNNMYKVIEKETYWWFLKWLRKRRAYKYYLAVRLGGEAAFKKLS